MILKLWTTDITQTHSHTTVLFVGSEAVGSWSSGDWLVKQTFPASTSLWNPSPCFSVLTHKVTFWGISITRMLPVLLHDNFILSQKRIFRVNEANEHWQQLRHFTMIIANIKGKKNQSWKIIDSISDMFVQFALSHIQPPRSAEFFISYSALSLTGK